MRARARSSSLALGLTLGAAGCDAIVGIGEHHLERDCEDAACSAAVDAGTGGTSLHAGGAASDGGGSARASGGRPSAGGTAASGGASDAGSGGRGAPPSGGGSGDGDGGARDASPPADGGSGAGGAATVDGGRDAGTDGGGADATAPDGARDGAPCATPGDRVYRVRAGAPPGGTGSPGCELGSLAAAFAAIEAGARDAGPGFTVEAEGTFDESTEGAGAFPLLVPDGGHLVGVGAARPVVIAPSGVSGFRYSLGRGGDVTNFVIRQATAGVKGAGIYVEGFGDGGASAEVVLSHLEIQNFHRGVLVTPDGFASITGDVRITGADAALYVIAGVLRVLAPSEAERVTFVGNRNGAWVQQGGILELTGAPAGDGTDRTIVFQDTSYHGIYVDSATGRDARTGAVMQVAGVSFRNAGTDAIRVLGGSAVRVRSSRFEGNRAGVWAQETAASRDFTGVDLGRIAAGDPGLNYFRANSPGICVDITDAAVPGPLRAEGNTFFQRDCATTTGPLGAADCATPNPAGSTLGAPLDASILSLANCYVP